MKFGAIPGVIFLTFLLHAHLNATTTKCKKRKFCNVMTDDADGRRFRDLTTGRLMQCQNGYVFEMDGDCGQCGILKLGYAQSNPCNPDLDITFADNRVADSRDAVYLETNGVKILSNVEGATDGFVGEFNGETSYIRVPFFESADLGARINITIRYREADSMADTGAGLTLLSNSADPDIQPTLAIVHSMSRNGILAAFSTTGNIFRELMVPFEPQMVHNWKTVTFDFDARRMGMDQARLILEGRRFDEESVIGNLQALRTPLVIGRSNFAANFKGQIDFIQISRCTPGMMMMNNGGAGD